MCSGTTYLPTTLLSRQRRAYPVYTFPGRVKREQFQADDIAELRTSDLHVRDLNTIAEIRERMSEGPLNVISTELDQVEIADEFGTVDIVPAIFLILKERKVRQARATSPSFLSIIFRNIGRRGWWKRPGSGI